MSTEILSHYEIVSQMPEDTVVAFHGVSWEEYEQLLEQVGERSGLRISYNDGTLQQSFISKSRGLPVVTSQVLADFLLRVPKDGEFDVILAFDEWLRQFNQTSVAE